MLMLKQPALAMQTPGIALEAAVPGDHAVAGYNDGDWIGANGGADVNGHARVVVA